MPSVCVLGDDPTSAWPDGILLEVTISQSQGAVKEGNQCLQRFVQNEKGDAPNDPQHVFCFHAIFRLLACCLENGSFIFSSLKTSEALTQTGCWKCSNRSLKCPPKVSENIFEEHKCSVWNVSCGLWNFSCDCSRDFTFLQCPVSQWWKMLEAVVCWW